MVEKKKNLSAFDSSELPDGSPYSVGIVVSSWNPQVTHSLRDGAREMLLTSGMKPEQIIEREVPGSFELPSGAQFLLENTAVDAVIILGCVIQGETRHFDFICQGVTQGIMDLNLRYQKPVIFGLLTTDTLQQALDRSGGKHGNKGVEAAYTALKMVDLWKTR